MLKGPEFRVVGSLPDSEKDKVKETAKGALYKEHLADTNKKQKEMLRKLEYPKTPQQKKIIEYVNQKTNELMVKIGAKPYDIPTRNLHILPPGMYKKYFGKSSAAVTNYRSQGIALDASIINRNLLSFGKISFHEILHLKGHFALEAERRDDKLCISNYREGISVNSTQKNNLEGLAHEHFRGLHEAIVSAYEKEFDKELMQLPFIQKELEWMASDEAKAIKEKIAKINRIDPKEIFWTNKEGTEFTAVNYAGPRRVLDFVCQEIQSQFPDKFADIESVRLEFLKAHFTGRLLVIGRLVDKTFGAGIFRRLGDMNDDIISANQTLEALKLVRKRQQIIDKEQGASIEEAKNK